MTDIEKDLLAIETMIYIIRDQRVMLDSDLAKLYGVTTKNLNKSVARNIKRFPEDFMFQLSEIEDESLRFQFGTSRSQFEDHQLRDIKSPIYLNPFSSSQLSEKLYIKLSL